MAADAPVPEVDGKLGGASSAPVPEMAISGAPAPAVSAGVVAAGVSRLKGYSMAVYEQRKPWSEFFDRNSVGWPSNLSDATGRIRRNLTYFKINYLVFMVLTTLVVMLMNPSSLFVLGGLGAAWSYVFVIRTTPITYNDRALTDREKLMGMSGISLVVVFFLTSVASVMFSALGLGVALVAAHGSVRMPDDLFLDDAEQSGSLLSIFSAPTGQPMAASV